MEAINEGNEDKPETTQFWGSKEHQNLVVRLKQERVIKSEKVINAMKVIDGKNYFSPGDKFEGLRMYGRRLEASAVYAEEGSNILYLNILSCSYVQLCLAQMVGEKGSVVGYVFGELQREMVEKDHNYFLTSKRLTLEAKDDFNEAKEGSPLCAPFDAIMGCNISSRLSAAERDELKKQLAPGGRVIDLTYDEVVVSNK